MKAEDVPVDHAEIAAVAIFLGEILRIPGAVGQWADEDEDVRQHYRDMARAAIAAVAPLIAKAERERCAAWHIEQSKGEMELAEAAERDGDRGGEHLHRNIASEHRVSAAIIRALPDA